MRAATNVRCVDKIDGCGKVEALVLPREMLSFVRWMIILSDGRKYTHNVRTNECMKVCCEGEIHAHRFPRINSTRALHFPFSIFHTWRFPQI